MAKHMWGDAFLQRDVQVRPATATCLSSKSSTLSALRRLPLALGNKIAVFRLAGSPSPAFSTATVDLVNGVHRSFRPFPMQRTWAPVPRITSVRRRPVNSDKRKPVRTATSSWA